MFFLPTLLSLIPTHHRVWIVCLSNGNYNGLGHTRETELQHVCTLLGVEQCIVSTTLQDNPNVAWPAPQVADVLDKTLQQHPVDDTTTPLHILTFDEKGVSGHLNHVDTYKGVCYWLSNNNNNNPHVQGWKLVTLSNLLIKYIPLLWIPMIVWNCVWLYTFSTLYTTVSPWLVWRCMATHYSQFVWFRKLSILFSVYSYQNMWSEIKISNDKEKIKSS